MPSKEKDSILGLVGESLNSTVFWFIFLNTEIHWERQNEQLTLKEAECDKHAFHTKIYFH